MKKANDSEYIYIYTSQGRKNYERGWRRATYFFIIGYCHVFGPDHVQHPLLSL